MDYLDLVEMDGADADVLADGSQDIPVSIQLDANHPYALYVINLSKH